MKLALRRDPHQLLLAGANLLSCSFLLSNILQLNRQRLHCLFTTMWSFSDTNDGVKGRIAALKPNLWKLLFLLNMMQCLCTSLSFFKKNNFHSENFPRAVYNICKKPQKNSVLRRDTHNDHTTGCFRKKCALWFCTFFNSPAFAESNTNNISILGLRLETSLTKIVVRTPYLKWRIMRFQSL